MYAVCIYIYISQSVYVTAYMNPSTEVCVNIFRLDSQKNGFPIECHWGTKKNTLNKPYIHIINAKSIPLHLIRAIIII